MYKIVFTKGNNEKIIAEFEALEKAKEVKKEYERLPEYVNGIVTIEERDEKTNTIKRLIG